MAKFLHSDVLNGGLDALVAAGTSLLLINNYTLNDSYATVVAAALCSVTIDTSDFSLAGAAGAPRTCTVAAQAGTASAASSSPNLHVAITDGAAKVLLVTDETSDQAIAISDPITFQAFTLTFEQPS